MIKHQNIQLKSKLIVSSLPYNFKKIDIYLIYILYIYLKTYFHIFLKYYLAQIHNNSERHEAYKMFAVDDMWNRLSKLIKLKINPHLPRTNTILYEWQKIKQNTNFKHDWHYQWTQNIKLSIIFNVLFWKNLFLFLLNLIIMYFFRF